LFFRVRFPNETYVSIEESRRTTSFNPFFTLVIAKINLQSSFLFFSMSLICRKALHTLGGSCLLYIINGSLKSKAQDHNKLTIFSSHKCSNYSHLEWLILAHYSICGTWDSLITWRCCSYVCICLLNCHTQFWNANRM
jgi:hypothetical protein